MDPEDAALVVRVQAGDADAFGALEQARAREHVAAAIKQLPPREREVLVLKKFEELKYREIAELIACGAAAAGAGAGGRTVTSPDDPDLDRAHAVAGLKNLVGGEIQEYAKLMADSREQAIDCMTASAKSCGANAVINVRFSTSYVMANASEIVVSGDAVVLEKDS